MESSHFTLARYLDCFGGNVDEWPEEAQRWFHGREPNLADAALIEGHKRFEALLLSRHFTPPSSDLAYRITAAARLKTPQPRRAGLWDTLPLRGFLRAYFRPTVLATVLALGFTLGFNMFPPTAQQGTASMQNYTDDEAVL